jgi:hypothetical protein
MKCPKRQSDNPDKNKFHGNCYTLLRYYTHDDSFSLITNYFPELVIPS